MTRVVQIAFDPEGIADSSQGLSAAIPLEHDRGRNAPRRGAGGWMPSTHLSLHYHVVFSTKNRHSWIEPDWRDDLHRYLGGCVKTLDGMPVVIEGELVADLAPPS